MYLRPYRVLFATMAVLTVLSSVTKIGPIVLVKPAIDLALGQFSPDDYARVPFLGSEFGQALLERIAVSLRERPWEGAGWLLLTSTLIFAVHALSLAGSTFLQRYIGGRVGMDVQRELVGKLFSQPVSYFARRGKGELYAVVGDDVARMRMLVFGVFDNYVRGLAEFGIALGLALMLNWKVTAIVGVVLLPIGAILSATGNSLKRRERRRFEASGVEGLILQEALATPQVVKAFQMEEYFSKRLEWARWEQFGHVMRIVRAEVTVKAVPRIFMGIALGAFSAYNLALIIQAGPESIGDFVVLYAALLFLFRPLEKMTKLYSEFVLQVQAAKRVFDLRDHVPGVRSADDAVDLPEVDGTIEFRDVRFSYGGGAPALDDVSFTINPGERVALVGPSGAGKSTLAAILLRLYDPQQGQVLIDGHDITQVTQQSLQRQLGLVTQENVLFSDSVRTNITCGVEADQERVEAVARAAQAHDFIQQLPDGYDTLLGDKGASLSGGQKQRLAVARCLFRNTPILVLDEATSALDAVTEDELQYALDKMTDGRTTIIIAHRFSTIQRAERIIFLEDGQVRGVGSHEELLLSNERYRELLRKQALTIDGLSQTEEVVQN